ncbi:nucleoside triphosphatase NudI [Stenotrophomonas sp. Sm3119]|uniref:nucleoside triphosphatase NudI n=1 Tax=Stenotrophomonas sp. Sm3119 TaxID=3002744 RepID=UPI0027E43B93|nr:nucleoside triphosphatase NudI [Stenotrophomonas sp. Sm3119]MDQ7306101.1 nucleoside triphosphatase NudI [Stenotrophomonas sp. Sm3119]
MRQRVIVCPLIQNQGAYLLCRMPLDRGAFPGQWALSGGGLEPDERIEEGLRREIREELGHALQIGAVQPWTFRDDIRTKLYPDGSSEQIHMIYLIFEGHVQDPDRTMEEAVAARPRRGLLGKLASCHGKVGGRGERYAAVLRDALNIIYIMRNQGSAEAEPSPPPHGNGWASGSALACGLSPRPCLFDADGGDGHTENERDQHSARCETHINLGQLGERGIPSHAARSCSWA